MFYVIYKEHDFKVETNLCFIYTHAHAHKERSHLKDVWHLDLSKIAIITITKLTFSEESDRNS